MSNIYREPIIQLFSVGDTICLKTEQKHVGILTNIKWGPRREKWFYAKPIEGTVFVGGKLDGLSEIILIRENFDRNP